MRRIPKVAQAMRSYDPRLELDTLSKSLMRMQATKRTVTVVVRVLWGLESGLSSMNVKTTCHMRRRYRSFRS